MYCNTALPRLRPLIRLAQVKGYSGFCLHFSAGKGYNLLTFEDTPQFARALRNKFAIRREKMEKVITLLAAIFVFSLCNPARATLDAPPVVWQKTFGGSDSDYGLSVQQTTDGGFIIAGYTDSFGAGYGDVYLVKVGFEGCQRWDFNCDKTVDFADLAEFANHWLEER